MAALRVALVGAAGRVAAPCHMHALTSPLTGEEMQLVALCDTDAQAHVHPPPNPSLISERCSIGILYEYYGGRCADQGSSLTTSGRVAGALAEGLRTVKVYTDYAALLQDDDIDAVDLVVPPYLHACAALCPCLAASASGSGPVCDCTRRCAGSEYAIAADCDSPGRPESPPRTEGHPCTVHHPL